jgi:hypothetical protein
LLRRAKARPHVRAAPAARPADEQRFEIGEPDIVGPLLATNARRVTALVIGKTGHVETGDAVMSRTALSKSPLAVGLRVRPHVGTDRMRPLAFVGRC